MDPYTFFLTHVLWGPINNVIDGNTRIRRPNGFIHVRVLCCNFSRPPHADSIHLLLFRWMALSCLDYHRIGNLRLGAWMPCVYLPRCAVARPGKQANTRSITIRTIPNVIAGSWPREDILLVRTGRSKLQREVLLPIARPNVLCCVLVHGRQKANDRGEEQICLL